MRISSLNYYSKLYTANFGCEDTGVWKEDKINVS